MCYVAMLHSVSNGSKGNRWIFDFIAFKGINKGKNNFSLIFFYNLQSSQKQKGNNI